VDKRGHFLQLYATLPLLKNCEDLYKFGARGVYGDETVNDKMEVNWCLRLYERKAAQLILYGRALGLSHSEAEDVVQETFVALMQMPQIPLRPEHYCVRSFRNRALNYRRSLWRRLTREMESWRWFEKSPGESPVECAAMRRLAELPVEQREVIVLKIWHRCTFEEIGGLLDISPNTVAGRYRYGLQKIKHQLEGAVYERDEFTGDATAFLAAAPPVSGT
jgi:RNA polymerase sigma-70 factor, ECF subfamily